MMNRINFVIDSSNPTTSWCLKLIQDCQDNLSNDSVDIHLDSANLIL